MLCALSILSKSDTKGSGEGARIYHVTTEAFQKAKRYNLDISSLITFSFIDYNDFQLASENHSSGLLKLIGELNQEVGKGTRVFLFNQHTFLASYLARHVKGLFIFCLVQDGLKAYARINRVAPRWRVRSWWRWQKAISQLKLPFHVLPMPSLVYGKLPGLNELWVSLPDCFPNRMKKRICGFEFLGNDIALEWTAKFFQLKNTTKELFSHTPLTLYLSQPLDNLRFQAYEIQIVKWLITLNPDRPFWIKPHPSLKFVAQQQALASIEGVNLIEQSLPAELFIGHLPKGSKVFSFWSTASLFPGNATHFWLHPLVQKEGLMLKGIQIFNPTNHIIEVVDESQLLENVYNV